MSVIVNQLSKIYGQQKAVDQATFEVAKGEVLGFLGPNGAGKSTTMKIISCFIPATGGRVEVCGTDTAKDPKTVRRHIGYLPEHNPLYKDMYVKEYLNFVAGLYKLPKKRQRIEEMIEMTGLEVEQRKPIGALSKGYRQRVGLAQAMIHDPDVLILDEPTSGLDPNQLVEIRALIKKIGAAKTVIFSTHIMQEVQAICDRVVIINKGRIVANDTIETLQDRVRGEMAVQVEFRQKVSAKQLESIQYVKGVKDLGERRWELKSDQQHDIRPLIFNFAVDQKLTLLEMQRDMISFENVFQQLTKKQ